MTAKRKNIAASVQQRLRNVLTQRGEDVQFALQRYAAERFLHRLGESEHRHRYVLKGAALYALWGGSIYRPTRDLDFTGYGASSEQEVLDAVRQICATKADDGGLEFDLATLSAQPIRDDAEYHGVRVTFTATLGSTRTQMQIDVGFGNAIEPPPLDVEYPTLLGDPPPRIRAYTQEAVIAEKLHAMVVLGERNSRSKDFYDMHVLAQGFDFRGERLVRAIAATFERRHTPIVATVPFALTARFYDDEARSTRWTTYLKRNRLPGAPEAFGTVGDKLNTFLTLPWTALAEDRAFTETWRPGGPWRKTGHVEGGS